MAYERLDKTYIDGAVWDGAAVSRIDDAIEELIGVEYEQSPNLWSLTLTTADMTNKYYVSGLPHESVDFGNAYPCTERIYLKDYAPQGETRVIDLKRNTKYTVRSVPILPNGYDTPWGSSIANRLFFYNEADEYLSAGFVTGSISTFIVPSTATHFRFNIHTFPTNTAKNISAVLSAMSKSLMVVEGTKVPEMYYAYDEKIEKPIGAVYSLINEFYETSPNLWGVKLTTNDLTGKYYMNGAPYTASTQFDANHQATEKIYLTKSAPEGTEMKVDLVPGLTYRVYSIPELPNKEPTPWLHDLSYGNRLFFYDENDKYLGNCFPDTSNASVFQVPVGSTYLRFNVSKYTTTFQDVIQGMNDSMMILKEDEELPAKYSVCGEKKFKDLSGLSGGIEKRQIFYSINDGVVDIISHYNSTHDLRHRMLRKGPNSIFDWAQFYLVSALPTGEVSSDISSESATWSWGGTDSHAPWVIKAVNNADGDNLNAAGTAHNAYFTGGNHGYNNTGSTTDNAATGRTSNIRLYADGKEVINGSGYCNQVKVYWENYIQAYNTTKSDGTGREVLREVHESIFDGYEWKEEISVYPLEDIVINTWYGIQGIGLSGAWKNGYFQGAKEKTANRNLLVFDGTATYTSNSKTSTKFVGFDDTKRFELEIDGEYDLGSGYLSTSEFKCFTSTSKVYFWIIKSSETLLPDTRYGLKAYYRFRPVAG